MTTVFFPVSCLHNLCSKVPEKQFVHFLVDNHAVRNFLPNKEFAEIGVSEIVCCAQQIKGVFLNGEIALNQRLFIGFYAGGNCS